MKTTSVNPSPLRRRFIDELTLRGWSVRTVETYVAWVYDLARYHHASPDVISDDQLKSYLLYLQSERKLCNNSIRQGVYALRSFYTIVLGRPEAELSKVLVTPRMEVRRPEIYSVEEIRQLLTVGAGELRQKAFLSTVYDAGLRLNEACHLRVEDIRPERMQLRVVQGKNKKDRYTILSESLLELLRQYWRAYRPQRWLFFRRRSPDQPMLDSTGQRMYWQAVARAGLPRRGGIHSLRHAFATQMLESGVDLPTVQRLLGHTSIKTTAHYLHLRAERLAQMRSPLDQIRQTPPR